MPADTNPLGRIFGGWIMSQMDIAGGIMANEIARSRVVTVAVESITFIKPVHVGDVVGCYGKIIRVSTTSITINLEVWVKAAQPRIAEELHMFKRLLRRPSPMWWLTLREESTLCCGTSSAYCNSTCRAVASRGGDNEALFFP